MNDISISNLNCPQNHLFEAVHHNDIGAVRYCLVHGSQIEHNDHALRVAAVKGHTSCVELLIPVSSSHGRVDALCAAVMQEHHDCIELLLPVSDTQAALEKFQFEYVEDPDFYKDLQRILAQQQKQVLETSLDGISAVPRVRKI